MTRKLIRMATLYVTITHTTEDGVETIINAQQLSGGLGQNQENRPLDWQEREVEDKLFGSIVTKSRRAKQSDLEHDFLREGWSEHSVEHGVINTQGQSNTPKSGTTWIAEQVCDLGATTVVISNVDILYEGVGHPGSRW